MRKEKKSIWKILYRIYLLLVVICFVFGILPFWTRAEARYARDNLEYLTGVLEKNGIREKINTHGIHAIRWPYPVAISEICNLSEAWAEGYLSVVSVSGIVDKYKRKLGLNPYDTLSRLVYDSADDDIGKAYFATMIMTAYLNPDQDVSMFDDSVLSQLITNARYDSAEACYNMQLKMLYSGIGYLMMIIPIILKNVIYGIRLMILGINERKKRSQKETEHVLHA